MGYEAEIKRRRLRERMAIQRDRTVDWVEHKAKETVTNVNMWAGWFSGTSLSHIMEVICSMRCRNTDPQY
jgi:hypothetical protein